MSQRGERMVENNQDNNEVLDKSYILLKLSEMSSFLGLISLTHEEINIQDIQVLASHFSIETENLSQYIIKHL